MSLLKTVLCETKTISYLIIRQDILSNNIWDIHLLTYKELPSLEAFENRTKKTET